MGYRVRIDVELFPKCRFRVCFLGSNKKFKCLEHLRDLRASFSSVCRPSLQLESLLSMPKITSCLSKRLNPAQGSNSQRYTLQKFSPEGWRWIRPKASATGSLNILVGLTLKVVYCVTVFELVWKTGLWFVLFWVGTLKSLFCRQSDRNIRFWGNSSEIIIHKIVASVGHRQRRSVPRRDQSAEIGECRKV